VPDFTQIIRGVTAEKFSEILGASARTARESYFHRHGIRAPKTPGLPRPGAKNQARTVSLYETIKKVDDDEMAEELLRNWFLTKRELLCKALDHLGVEHEDGLTESDEIARFEKLSPKDLKKLGEDLAKDSPREDVMLYLKFMGAKKVDETLGA